MFYTISLKSGKQLGSFKTKAQAQEYQAITPVKMIVSRTSCISDTVLTIVKEFIHYNVLEDRLEYSVEDLACSFPSCTELEITELYNLLQDQL